MTLKNRHTIKRYRLLRSNKIVYTQHQWQTKSTKCSKLKTTIEMNENTNIRSNIEVSINTKQLSKEHKSISQLMYHI